MQLTKHIFGWDTLREFAISVGLTYTYVFVDFVLGFWNPNSKVIGYITKRTLQLLVKENVAGMRLHLSK